MNRKTRIQIILIAVLFSLLYLSSIESASSPDAPLESTHTSPVSFYPSSGIEFTSITGFGSSLQINIESDRHIGAIHTKCTGSMHPAQGCENTVLYERLEPEDEVNIGDIVVYEKADNFILHQVVAIDGDCYRTKGINNQNPDNMCILREDIQYREIGVLYTR